jgi:hypothetical protein
MSERPTLERILIYRGVLERLRSEKTQISCGELVLEIDTLPADVVRDDFVAMGLPWSSRGTVDLNQAYWAVVNEQFTAESEIAAGVSIDLTMPSEAEISAALPRRETPERAKRALEAAQIIDRSFDGLADFPLGLIGHGRMSNGTVAFQHQLRTAKYVMEDMN